MAEMTQPEREAIHALHYGLKRESLGMAAQLEYDRLKDEYVPGEMGQIFAPAPRHLIVTTNDIPGYRITTVHGDVFGLIVRARNYFGNVGAQFRTLVGGEVAGYTKLLTDSRKQARERMWDEARALGGNAVVAMRFDCNEIGDVMSEVVAYGTAVTVEPLGDVSMPDEARPATVSTV